MQTLRKRTSPCKYKNDPSRFLGEGITFKAKLIGILEVNEARGDKMCQDALNDLKTAIRAAGEHKQRITISISIDGLRLRDEKTGDCLYHHPVHKISFIAQDMSDSRAFGYIFGSPDTGHRFFGIKTDKTASQVVISMRDLFQVVFELKKKEIEMAKHHSEAHHFKYGSTGYMDAIHFPKDESELDKGKGKYPHIIKSRCLTSKSGDSGPPDHKGPSSEAIADLLDLEHELNTIQQGINQMDKITPSDPFGPLSSKTDTYADPFDDSFPTKPPEEEGPAEKDTTDRDNHFYKPSFLSQFSPGAGKSRAEDVKWTDQDTDSLFRETEIGGGGDATSSPVALATSALEPEQTEGKKSPIKTDLFTELDPLGTGRVKPYVDKKDFFQELKNPPRKVLKEMITGPSSSSPALDADLPSFYFPRHFKDQKNPLKSDSSALDPIQGFQEGKPSKIDPFDDGDPFEETDPFQEVIFPSFGTRSSIDGIFDDKLYWSFDKSLPKEEKTGKASSSGGALRVSLPPEKTDVPISISTITSKLKSSSPPSPEDSKAIRRKCYQSLKQSTLEGSEESPVREELFISVKIGSKSEWDKSSPFKNKFYSPLYPRDPQLHSSAEILDDSTPDPPPRAKTALFSIKPPPLPPKKQNPKPPARPPSFEDKFSHYDYLEKKEISDASEDVKCVKLKKQVLSDTAPSSELKKQNSSSGFPVLPPPPHRKISGDSNKVLPRKAKLEETPTGSVLNLKLNQLDNTGLENLAISLGIPSENIYSMTLQELTKMLAEKYLTETKSEESKSFEADFDANFGTAEKTTPSPSYDKYAVFKELIESDKKEPEALQDVSGKNDERGVIDQEEDKYAALRQLSLSAQADNFSEDDECGEVKASASPKLTQDSSTGHGGPEPKRPPLDNRTEDKRGAAAAEGADAPSPRDQNPSFLSDSQLFPLVDQFSEEKKPTSPRDNWATFEKSDFEEHGKKSAENFNENENSPLSSDGKEEVREIPFEWHAKTFGKRERKDVPWRDDDESWDDYSPKESYCSDESSHEERSPECGGNDSYEKTWSLCGRPPKLWNRREKWQEETEDEFEESWRKQRVKSGSYETERKNLWHNNYEGYNKKYDWYGNTRSEPWDENDRHHYYGTRRKRSESDNEYRKRCDSDASEKEFVWTFQKDSPDVRGRAGKQKQYRGPGHCLDHCHEPRSKHRKAASQKRPTSASEPKRNYEKFSPGDYTSRASDKSYSKREPDNSRFIYKESSYRGVGDFPRYCSSYDRKASRAGNRENRVSGPDVFPKRGEPTESKNQKFGYFEPFSEKNYKYGKGSGSQFPGEAGKVKKGSGGAEEEFQERRPANQWASANGKSEVFYSARNNNEEFGSFREEFKSPSKTLKGNGKAESCEAGKRGKSHLGMLGRQETGSALRKSDSVNIFSRDKDPFEGDDFFSSVS